MRSGSFQFAMAGVSTRSFACSPARKPEADESPSGPVPLLGEYGVSWLESISGLVSRVTFENYSGQLERHVLPRLGERRLDEIGVDDILILIGDLRERGYAGWTIHSILKPLSRVFAHAQRGGLIAVNPISQLERRERPRTGRCEQRILNRDEIGRLLEAAAPRYRTLLATAILSGLRQGELLGLRWRDIDLTDEVIHVRSALDRQRRDKPPKTERAVRDVVLMPGLARLLEAHRKQSMFKAAGDYVFATQLGTPLHWANVSKRALKPALKKAGIQPIRWHDLRHTFASVLIAGGANVVFVSHQLGHSSTDITLRVYAHRFDSAEQAHRTREMLEEMFGEVI
jgi:integrase